MSVDLGAPGWRLVGFVDGFAMLTNDKQSRWADLRTWPARLLPLRDEVVRAVCRGATLTDRAYTWTAPDKKRTELPRVTASAIGFLDAKPAVPGMIFDGVWHPIGGTAGAGTHHAIAGTLVVWAGRVLRYEAGTLVDTHAGDLPAGDTTVVPTDDGFLAAAGGKLVVVSRHGKQRDDRTLGIAIDSVARYEDHLLVRAADRYYLDDAPLDLGSSLPHPRVVFAAPCGLLGIAGRTLVRFRV